MENFSLKFSLSVRTLALVVTTFQWLTVGAQAGSLFSDQTVAAGIDAQHHFNYSITGQAWGDYNRDGCPDLYLTDSEGINKLFRNNCQGTFGLYDLNHEVELASATSGGASWGDFDNDGWPDLVVLAYGSNTLFRNNAGTGFVDVTIAAGLDDNTSHSETAAWGDYDGDGYLDLYIVNYEPLGTPQSEDLLYRNTGMGTFENVTHLMAPEPLRRSGFTARWLDFDSDGDLDLYVANDKFHGNVLWRNDGNGCGGWCFTDVSVATGAARPADSMGIAAADYDNDGDLDLYYSGTNEAVMLQSQVAQGAHQFIEVTDSAGTNYAAIGWGTLFLDYDNDGLQDIYLSLADAGNRLFHNQGDGTFVDVSAASGASDPGPTMGSAVSDYDSDGALDFVIGNANESYVLYRNTGSQAADNNWLRFDLIGGFGVNRDAIGARVYVSTSDGVTQMQDVRSGNSLGAGSERILHFGLGQFESAGVEVVWPNGEIHILPDVAANQNMRVFYREKFLSTGFED